eukprot:SAG31_NODE_20651_length_568_cov_1.799574_2_plen_50_part_01
MTMLPSYVRTGTGYTITLTKFYLGDATAYSVVSSIVYTNIYSFVIKRIVH